MENGALNKQPCRHSLRNSQTKLQDSPNAKCKKLYLETTMNRGGEHNSGFRKSETLNPKSKTNHHIQNPNKTNGSNIFDFEKI
jgi:hypothetical protein